MDLNINSANYAPGVQGGHALGPYIQNGENLK